MSWPTRRCPQARPTSSGWASLAQFVAERTVISLLVATLILGRVFAATNAIGLTNTNPDAPAPDRKSPTDQTAERAWLSPNQAGDDCRWMPGQASEYGDPWSFCNYSAP